MRRSTLLVCLSLAAITVFVVVVATGSAQNPGGQTARFTESGTKSRRVDNPPRGRSAGIGDVYIFNASVLDAARHRIGSHRGVCTVVSARPFRAQCSDTFVLPAGQLYTQGVFSNASSNRAGIVGGTGAYEVSRGSVNITNGRGGDVLDFNVFR
jgi:hypothetical protein